MKIRIEGGNRAPDVVSGGGAPPALAFGTGAALQNAGDAMMQIAGHAIDKQNAEELARKKEADRVAAITAQAETKNALADLHDELVSGMNDGRYDKAKIGDLWTEKSQKIIADSIEKVPQEHQALVRALLLDDQGRAQRLIRGAVDKRNQQDIDAGIITYVEEMQRYAMRGDVERQEAMRNVQAVLESAGPKAGYTAEAITKQTQAFKEGVTFNSLDARITRAQRDGKALSTIANELGGGQYAELDPAKRNFLEAKIQRNQQHLAQMGEIAERRKLSKLNTMAQRLNWYVENGRDIPPAEFDAFDKASKGTEWAGFAQQVAGEQKSIAEFSKLSPQQMVTRVNEITKEYGPTPSKEQLIHLAKLNRYVENSVKQLRESPLDYAAHREGAIVEPLDLAKPDSWGDNLAHRTEILREQAKRTGVEPKGLLPQEANALTAFLSSASDDSKAATLKMLRKGFGDDRVFRATMQQIAKDSPVTALAGTIATRERPMTVSGIFSDDTYSPGSTAALMLRGERLLNPGKADKAQDGKTRFPMPKEEDIRAKFNDYAGEAFAGNAEAYEIAYQGAKAVYAGLASDGGDYSGQVNSKLLKQAVQRSTGGVTSINGAGAVVKPWGMDDSTFKDAAYKGFRKAVVDSGLPQTVIDQWPRLGLQNTKGGYLVRSGTGYLLGKDGNPVMVKIDDPTLGSGRVEKIPK